jgi:hypothetical protein
MQSGQRTGASSKRIFIYKKKKEKELKKKKKRRKEYIEKEKKERALLHPAGSLDTYTLCSFNFYVLQLVKEHCVCSVKTGRGSREREFDTLPETLSSPF